MAEPISDDMLDALERESGRGLDMHAYMAVRVLAELRAARAALKARDESAVARFLAHPAAEWIGRGEYAVKPREPIYDHWMAEFKTYVDGEEYGTRRWGATPEAACAAALRAIEPERGGDHD